MVEPAQGERPVRARIRRLYVPDAVYFITAVTHKRHPIFNRDDRIDLLRKTVRAVKKIHPFQMRAYVWLPDHIHLLLKVEEANDISTILQSIKRNFTLNLKNAEGMSGKITLWQRGFWDHVIRNDKDYVKHIDYIHYNPVKHGLVASPAAYPHSSFAHYVRLDWYDADWGATAPDDIQALNLE